MMNRWLGNYLEKMEVLELFNSTLLLVISDHGVAFGEHGITGRPAYALWPEVMEIAFFIRYRGQESWGGERPLRLNPRRGPHGAGSSRGFLWA